MRRQIRGLDRAATNADDGVSTVQTAEGALTEVHDMLQRMNELANQASNGTNSVSDRESIQNEINQLTTEIDRVAETTKFNETYALKGATGFKDIYMNAHDAGLNGTLSDLGGRGGKDATFTIDVMTNTDMTIAAREYHIYDANTDSIGKIQGQISDALTSNTYTSVTINGTTYTNGYSSDVGPSAQNLVYPNGNAAEKVWKYGDEEFTLDQIKSLVVDGAKVAIGTNEARQAVDAGLDKNITVSKALAKIDDALTQANKIGVDSNKQGNVSVSTNHAINKSTGAKLAAASQGKAEGRYTFSIAKSTANVRKDLGLQLHVGADADMTNKITVDIKQMNSAQLGIQNLNVVDTSGVAATYAIDAIEDAIKTVSAQRSELGAIQNRLEHTIKNLDNVVENTQAAESQIRDTDMATEMVKYSNNNILAQAGQSMLAQANQSNQGVLSLLG